MKTVSPSLGLPRPEWVSTYCRSHLGSTSATFPRAVAAGLACTATALVSHTTELQLPHSLQLFT